MALNIMSLNGQVAIVTGSRRGLGKAISLAFAEAGADVAICDKEDDGGQLDTVAKTISDLGQRSVAIRTDCTNRSQIENLVRTVEEELGSIDILVNNAGGGAAKYGHRFFMETSEEDWDGYFSLNFKSCLLCTQVVGQRMMQRKMGKIINISSIGAKLGPVSAYNCAKASMDRFTKGAALDFGKYNIRVNCIEPAIIDSGSRSKEQIKATSERFLKMIPLGKIGEAEEVAKCALFLASNASSYITGVTIPIDGGYTLGFMEHATGLVYY